MIFCLVDYADLPVIDLAKAQSPEERAQLASQVQDALLTHGFFYVINHGYLSSQASILTCRAAYWSHPEADRSDV
jgi:isopenicillin N synthase-like dioxygenase